MLGGALVLGGWARWRRRVEPRHGFFIALGSMILANTRPFEGLFVCIPVFVGIARRGFKDDEKKRVSLVTMLIVCGFSAALMARYNQEVTGSAFTLPYSLYEKNYNPAPIFAAFQSPKEPRAYQHDVLRRFFVDWCSEQVDRQSTFRGWWSYHRERLEWMRAFFVGPLLLPLLVLPWTLRAKTLWVVFGILSGVMGVHFLTVGIQPHYAAPLVCCYFLLIVEGMRRISIIRFRGFPLGRFVNTFTCLMVVMNLALVIERRINEPSGWETARHEIERSLLLSGGRHVVVVRYSPDHDLLHEWVANGADIDSSKIVWAREMSAMKDLRKYFRDRMFWLVDADEAIPTLKAFPELSRSER